MKIYQSPNRKLDEEGDKLARRMREARRKLGYRQDEMAFLFDVSRYTYMRWERQGPPNTRAHRNYVRIILRKLSQGDIKYAKRKAEKKNARLAAPADG